MMVICCSFLLLTVIHTALGTAQWVDGHQNIAVGYVPGECSLFDWAYTSDEDIQYIRWKFTPTGGNKITIAVLSSGETSPGYVKDGYHIIWNDENVAAIQVCNFQDADANGTYDIEVKLESGAELFGSVTSLIKCDLSDNVRLKINGKDVALNSTIGKAFTSFNISVEMKCSVSANITIMIWGSAGSVIDSNNCIMSKSCNYYFKKQATQIGVYLDYATYHQTIITKIADTASTDSSSTNGVSAYINTPATLLSADSVTVETDTATNNAFTTLDVTPSKATTSDNKRDNADNNNRDTRLDTWHIALIVVGIILSIICIVVLISYLHKIDKKYSSKPRNQLHMAHARAYVSSSYSSDKQLRSQQKHYRSTCPAESKYSFHKSDPRDRRKLGYAGVLVAEGHQPVVNIRSKRGDTNNRIPFSNITTRFTGNYFKQTYTNNLYEPNPDYDF